MPPRSTPICGFLMAGLALLLTGAAQAQLLRDSPFKSRASSAAVEATKLPLEFCGYIQTRDGLQFRVRDPEKKRAAFVQLNVAEPELGIVARRHDAESDTLVVEYEGRTLNLPQQTSKVRPAAAGPAPAGPATLPRPPVTRPLPVVPARPLSPDEFRAEIIRLRQEREKAASAKNPPATTGRD
jgi:hypothetical protein